MQYICLIAAKTTITLQLSICTVPNNEHEDQDRSTAKIKENRVEKVALVDVRQIVTLILFDFLHTGSVIAYKEIAWGTWYVFKDSDMLIWWRAPLVKISSSPKRDSRNILGYGKMKGA